MPPSNLAGLHLYRLTSAFPLLKTTSPRRHLPEHDSFQLFSFLSLNLCRHCSPTQNAFLCLVRETLESESEVAQSCPTLCDPMDCRRPGPSIHGIFQARILEWGAIFFSRGSSWPRDWTQVYRIAGRLFTLWATGEHLLIVKYSMTTPVF